MPLGTEYSMVADSTISSSPEPLVDASLEVKRALRTYGRRREEPQVEDPDSSISYSEAPPSLRSSVHNTAPPGLQDEIPPSSPRVHLNDSDPGQHNTDEESTSQMPQFEFDWKRKLKAMDDDEDAEISTLAEPDVSNQISFGQPLLLQGTTDSLLGSNKTNDRRDSSALPFVADDVFGPDSFSGRVESPRGGPARSSFTLSSPPPQSIRSRGRGRRSKIVHDSDSEQDVPKDSSPASSLSKHLFNTPNSGSSSTQPTSEDDMPPKTSAKPRSTGKQNADAASRSSVTPLVFIEEPTSEVKNTHASKNSKKNIKAPTQKEKAEMFKERSRLAVHSAVSIPRAEERKWTKDYFFAKIQSSVQVQEAPDPKESIPTSDPIVSFSSPVKATSASPARNDGPPHSKPRQKTPVPKDLPENHDSDEDSDLPDIGEILTKDLLADTKRKDLFEMKRRALQQQKRPAPIDDDDDLEIVVSNPKVAVKEEEEHRRSAKKRPSEGRKRQLHLAKINPAKQATKNISALSPARKTKGDISSVIFRQTTDAGTLDQKELNQLLAAEAQKRARDVTTKKEEEWKKHGGRVRVNPGLADGLATVLKTVAEKGLKATEANGNGEMEIDEEEDASDEDWDPAIRGSASPEPADNEEEGEGEENDENLPVDGDITMADDPDTQDENDLKVRASRRRVVDSESENEEENDENAPIRAPSNRASSCELPTEEEDDKENNTRLMYDRSEDKENTAVVRHGPLAPRSLFNGDDILSPPLSPVVALGSWSARNQDVDLGDESSVERRPFKELMSEESPLSSQTRPTNLSQSFAAKLQQASPLSSTLAPSPTLKPLLNAGGSSSEGFGGGFSQFSDGEGDVFGGAPLLQPGFSDLFQTTQKQEPRMELKKEGDLGELKRADTLELTQGFSEGLKPAFKAKDGLLRKSDAIFEKEQVFLLEAATKQPLSKRPTLYVNDHGFLTQTRPADGSPEVYRPSPSQTLYSSSSCHGPMLSPSQTQSGLRAPLRTLSISSPYPPDSPEVQHRRLRRRDGTQMMNDRQVDSPISTEHPRALNAFDILGRAAEKAKKREDLKQRADLAAEFFENEAAESDEDDAFGFVKPKTDEDEEDGEDLDQNLVELVDDAEMDEKAIAEKLVQEKFREQLEVQDQEDQKFHQALVQGEQRLKRRRGVGVDDSDEESEADDNSKVRRLMKKSRGDIEDLEADESTRAFAESYNQTLRDDADADEFSFLNKESQLDDIITDRMPMDHGDEDQDDEEENDQENQLETITHDEVVRLFREKKEQGIEDVEMDLTDVSWVDRDDEEEAPRVKTANVRQRPRGRTQESEMDGMGAAFRKSANEMSISSKQWFKQENKSRNAGTSRSVGGSAITGHAKAKSQTGNGSLRKTSLATKSTSGSTSSTSGNKPRTAPSMLSIISDKSRHFK